MADRKYGNVQIRRPVYTQTDLQESFSRPKKEKPIGAAIKGNVRSALTCSKQKVKSLCSSLFPFVGIMRSYEWRTDLPNDIIAGFTVGVMQLPQGMAYALLAALPPVIGLYMSFFPVIVYYFFGTSRQISVGTVAVVSLLVGGVLEKVGTMPSQAHGIPTINDTMGYDVMNNTWVDTDEGEDLSLNVRIAASMALIAGITQLIMGMARMGVVTTYMSEPLVSGFTTGAAVHVGTSQIKYIFGLKIPRNPGMFQVPMTYYEIFSRIVQTNVPTLIISIIGIIILYIVKVQVNYRFKHRLKVPIPIELIVVIIGTIASHFGNFHEIYNVKVVGNIPAGFPTPSVPTFERADQYLSQGVLIAVIGFAQSVSLAVIMAKKHGYEIDANKELIGFGMANLFSCFFSCYPCACSVSRSSVQDSAGSRTQVCSLFASALVLVVILAIGPLFRNLPVCMLSAIIVVALRTMIYQVFVLKKLWRTCKYDFVVWIATFLIVVILHVDIGLTIGIGLSIFFVVVRAQRTKVVIAGRITDSELYKSQKKYKVHIPQDNVRIIQYDTPLFFANSDMFRRKLFEVTGWHPNKIAKQRRKTGGANFNEPEEERLMLPDFDVAPDKEKRSPEDVRHPSRCIILDCSSMSFIDTVGVTILEQTFGEYRAVDIVILLVALSDDAINTLEAVGFWDKYKHLCFISVQDAMATISSEMLEINGRPYDKKYTDQSPV